LSKAEFGDFQTPANLVDLILRQLSQLGFKWDRVLEPTCGEGSFIRGLLAMTKPPKEVQGMEIQPEYVEQARQISAPPHVRLQIHSADFFQTDLQALGWRSEGPLLVLGNPPWVTNAALGALGSSNLPEKTNFKNLSGLDAMTGESNFDIAEYIWLKLMMDLREASPTIGLLCKTSVARNVLKFSQARGLPMQNAAIYRIDAKRWFNAAADACFFLVEMSPGHARYEADVYGDLSSPEKIARLGFVEGRLVADMDAYKAVSFLDARSPQMEWRQGLKHDAAPVMELTRSDAGWVNQAGESVDVEDDYVFPLVKAGDVRVPASDRVQRGVIVPQRTLGESMDRLQSEAPRLWRYLENHREVFDRRKSSIYRGKEPYAIFGIGLYSFAPFKVIVSGLHKTPVFAVVGPEQGKPVMCDDTCYLLPFHSPIEAARVGAALNQPLAQEFLGSVVFWDAKRPITKALLKRVDLNALLEAIPANELKLKAQVILDGLETAEAPSQEDLVSQMSLDVGAS
jgi:hypothetical protein